MIDLHCHLLPGIDDGPKSMEQALAMARFAVTQGIKRSVLTPHIQPGCYDNDIGNIQATFSIYQQALADDGIPLEVNMAAEVRACGELPVMINQGKIPFLGQWQGKKVILLEFPHDHLPLGSDKLVKWLLDRQIVPLIAHPERNQSIMHQPDKVEIFVKMGCLLQITAGSVTGLFGALSQKCALFYIENAMATVIATDAHNLHKRQPSMLEAKRKLIPLIGEEHVETLTSSNPALILS